MSDANKNKIEQSGLLPDFAKDIYREERERFLKNKIDEKDEAINNALKSINVNYNFIFG